MSDSSRPPAISPGRRDPAGARLFTTWGTAVYVDPGSRELRHGPIDESPANAHFVDDGTSPSGLLGGTFCYAADDGVDHAVCAAARSWFPSKSGDDADAGDPTRFEIVQLERGLLGLRSGGLYLCAQPDGRLTLANPWCSTWECFLASEDWCTPPNREARDRSRTDGSINWRRILDYTVDPLLRAQSRHTAATKILIFGHTQWSHGRVYYDVCKALSERGYVIDLLDWTVGQGWKIQRLLAYYDFVLCALNGMDVLADIYGVPYDRIIALSHHETDMRILIEQKGADVFDRFAAYGVVGYQLVDASAIFGIQRPPQVVPVGVDYPAFFSQVPERLGVVGYAGLYSHKTIHGVEIKRGVIAESATHRANLEFKPAISPNGMLSFHDMPSFYRSVDAILVSSLSEGAQLPVREAAAAGRLVISTPVGDFPVRAAQGCGIIAPIESGKYIDFVAETLTHYKANPAEFAEACRKIQSAARQLDWPNVIDDWIELIDSARRNQFATDPQRMVPAGAGGTTSALADLDLEKECRHLDRETLITKTDLCRLMTSFGSDKGHPFHNYTVVYDRLFSKFRNQIFNVFELGLGTNRPGAPSSMGPAGKPGASLRCWAAYFPHAKIYGADVDRDILFEEERIQTFWTDSRSPRAIRAMWDTLGELCFDVIIDDGLHEISSNLCFLMESFGRLTSGGLYVIEDIPPQDAEPMRAFAERISDLCSHSVYMTLDHPQNQIDNRLLILQKA